MLECLSAQTGIVYIAALTALVHLQPLCIQELPISASQSRAGRSKLPGCTQSWYIVSTGPCSASGVVGSCHFVRWRCLFWWTVGREASRMKLRTCRHLSMARKTPCCMCYRLAVSGMLSVVQQQLCSHEDGNRVAGGSNRAVTQLWPELVFWACESSP